MTGIRCNWTRPNLAARIVLALVASLLTSAPASTADGAPTAVAVRDWIKAPAIVEMDAVPRLYAVGDAHGDFQRLVELFAATKLVAEPVSKPSDAKWAGGAAVLVCTGDMIDKYTQSIQVIELMRTLQPQAERAGGRVIVTLGNHEAEFLGSGGEDKKSSVFRDALTAAGISPPDVAAGVDRLGIGAWLRDLPAGAKVGDWFFCHAGNTGARTLAQLRTQLQKDITENGFSAPILSDANSMLEARLHPRQWWDAAGDIKLEDDPKPRKLLLPGAEPRQADRASADHLRAIVKPLGVSHLVIGHQPGKIMFADGTVRPAGQMFTRFAGLLFLIDTGMSRGVGDGQGAVLFIRQSASAASADALLADGKTEHLWR